MKNNIKISVVVPIYNEQDYLKKSIESIINQSYENLEIILVDDGSTDHSSQICDYYAEVDNRIRVIHKKNGGIINAKKAGIAAATGDYILDMDGDDWIEEDRIEYLVKEGIMPVEADMVYMGGYKEDNGGNSQLTRDYVIEKTFYGDEIEKQILPLLCSVKEDFFNLKIAAAMWAWAIKRELLQEKEQLLDDRIIVGEDFACIWFCLLSAHCVTMIKQSGYHHVQRNTSITYDTQKPDSNYVQSTNILFHQVKQYIESHSAYPEEAKQILIYDIMKRGLIMHYELILEKHSDYLYPFPKVKKGCRIVVYGAGMMGIRLMKFLAGSKEYQAVLWVDKNIKKVALPEYKISPIADIEQTEYDYIVIAVTYGDISKKIKDSLMFMGISEEKIALIDPSVITEDALPDEIKY